MVHLVEAVDTTMATVAAVVDTAAEATVVAAAGKLYLFENLFEFAFCRSLMTAMLLWYFSLRVQLRRWRLRRWRWL